MTLTRIVESIVRNENSVLTVSCYLENYHGIGDVCLSIPAILSRDGVKRIIDLPLSKKEEEAFQKSADAVKEIIKSLGL